MESISITENQQIWSRIVGVTTVGAPRRWMWTCPYTVERCTDLWPHTRQRCQPRIYSPVMSDSFRVSLTLRSGHTAWLRLCHYQRPAITLHFFLQLLGASWHFSQCAQRGSGAIRHGTIDFHAHKWKTAFDTPEPYISYISRKSGTMTAILYDIITGPRPSA